MFIKGTVNIPYTTVNDLCIKWDTRFELTIECKYCKYTDSSIDTHNNKHMFLLTI